MRPFLVETRLAVSPVATPASALQREAGQAPSLQSEEYATWAIGNDYSLARSIAITSSGVITPVS
jgi:hypothetical protein